MHPTPEETNNAPPPPRRRWGDGIRRRRLQRAQSAPVGSPSPPCSKQDTSESNAEGTDSLVTLLEERSKELLLRRPDRISITYARKSNDEKLGLCLRVVKTAGPTDGNKKYKNNSNTAAAFTQIQIDGKCPTTGDGGPLSQINASALRDGSHHSLTFFEPGDFLEHVNDLDCRTIKSLGEINAHLENNKSRESGDVNDSNGYNNSSNDTVKDNAGGEKLSIYPPLTTIAVSTPGNQQDDAILTTLGVQLCQSIAMRSDSNNTGVPYIGLQFGQPDGSEEGGLLSVRKLLDGGWFDSPACAIKEGDLVVGINEYICATLSPSDAQVLLEAVAEQSTQLSITTLSLPKGDAKGKLAKLRKAAVAAGGGSLVVCGSALMVTPLHPIGHAMALGGVGVLSTEYEAPKRALESAKNRLRRSPKLGSENEEDDKGAGENDDDTKDDGESAGTPPGTVEDENVES